MSRILDKIKELLETQQVETYSRYDGEHPLDIFLGIDNAGRKSLVVTLPSGKEKVISTQTITAEFFNRKDGRLSLRFSLEDDSLKEIFYKFCEDVIESTRTVSPESGFSPIVRRWNTWIDFFAKTSLPLSESEVIGLIGELHFMKTYMFEKYGIDKSLDAFIGVDRAHKDFEIDDTWYEVKTIHNGKNTIKISSIEQLDSDREGQLAVITLDQGTLNNDSFISLNEIAKQVRSSLSGSQLIAFDEKLRKANYIYDERYDDFVYLFIKRDLYGVTGEFPVVAGSSLPHGVIKASYEIDLSAIERFKV